jgi:hypothetical protein
VTDPAFVTDKRRMMVVWWPQKGNQAEAGLENGTRDQIPPSMPPLVFPNHG